MRGRKPKPPALSLVDGNPGGRDIPDVPESAPLRSFDPPDWLYGEGLKEWHRLAKHLARIGLLTEDSFSQVASYCSMYGHMVEAEREVQVNGLTLTNPNTGKTEKSASFRAAQEAAAAMIKAASEFGLTPASRARVVKLGEDAAEDEAIFG